MFRYCEKQIFDGKSWHNRLKHKIVRYPKINDTLNGSPTKFLGTVRQKFLQENLDTPPFLSLNFFATRNFLKHSTEGLLYEKFLYCETKSSRRKIVT